MTCIHLRDPSAVVIMKLVGVGIADISSFWCPCCYRHTKDEADNNTENEQLFCTHRITSYEQLISQ